MNAITVAAIQVGEGRKPSVIVTTEGAKLKCFPDKIDRFGIAVGLSFNVETEDYTSQYGTSRTIVKAKQITMGSMATPAAPVRDARHPNPSLLAFRTPEQMFVSELICAYIAAGKCADPAKLKEAIASIRQAYNQNWGPNAGTFAANDAGPIREAAE